MVVSPLKWQLSAESNTLGVQGVAAVLKGLAANKALTALDLCDNDLDEQSGIQLQQAIEASSTLKELGLSKNQLCGAQRLSLKPV